jgi:hypothetical protein
VLLDLGQVARDSPTTPHCSRIGTHHMQSGTAKTGRTAGEICTSYLVHCPWSLRVEETQGARGHRRAFPRILLRCGASDFEHPVHDNNLTNGGFCGTISGAVLYSGDLLRVRSCTTRTQYCHESPPTSGPGLYSWIFLWRDTRQGNVVSVGVPVQITFQSAGIPTRLLEISLALAGNPTSRFSYVGIFTFFPVFGGKLIGM